MCVCNLLTCPSLSETYLHLQLPNINKSALSDFTDS